MMKIMQFIPGFRSDKVWKKIIAIIYYLISLLMLTSGLGPFLVLASAPFIVFSLIDLVLHKKKAIPIKKALVPFALSIALLITGFTIFPTVPDDQATQSSQGKTTVQSEKDKSAEDQEAAALAARKAEEAQKQKELEEQQRKEEEAALIAAAETAKSEIDTAQPEEAPEKQEEAAETNAAVSGQLKVHFIDVGQADSILIHTGDSAMLIDAGNSSDGSSISGYIKSQGINKLDYVIATHPHADHIGGMASVIRSIEVDKIIMPKVSHTTKTFEDLLLTIKDKGLKVTSPTPGSDYQLGSSSLKILAPNGSSYKDLNGYSVVARLTFGQTSFLFTGDADTSSESQIISKGYDLKSDVLKVGHHGSKTSTGSQFLKAITPKYAVISVGKGNSYGHPTQATLGRLAASSVELYRTDESGTIIATSDGNVITFDKKASPIKPNAPPDTVEKTETKPAATTPKPAVKPAPAPTENQGTTVYITKTGSKYHSDGCQYLAKSKIPISLSKAKSKYGPCSKCNPPR